MTTTTPTRQPAGAKPALIILRDGVLEVRGAPDRLKGKLRFFRKEIKLVKYRREVATRFEDLYSEDPEDTKRIFTMPGFAHRVLEFFRNAGIPHEFSDMRTRMPKPDLARAFNGLRPYQVELAGKMLTSGGGVLQASTGCLGEGTPVRMADGSVKTVEDVVPGDELLSFDDRSMKLTTSTVCEMIRTSPKHNPKPMLEVAIDGERITVTYDHHFFAGDGFYPLYQLVWGAMEERQRAQLKLLCEQYGAPFDDSAVWGKHSCSNAPGLRPEWILQDGSRWAYREGSQDSCGKLAEESPWASSGEPYRLQSFEQQGGQPGMVFDEVQCVVWGNPWRNKGVPPSEAGHSDTGGKGGNTSSVPGEDWRRENPEKQPRQGQGNDIPADTGGIPACPEGVDGVAGKVRLRNLVSVKEAAAYYTIRTREAPYAYCIGRRNCHLTHNSGKTAISAAIVRAFDRNELAARGTPTCVFACPDRDINRKNWEEFRKWLPDREIGLIMSGTAHKPSDDVVCCTIDSLENIDPSTVGVLIVDEMHASASSDRAGKISAFSRAARWGVSATPTGRFDGADIVSEGLYGPIVARFSYQDGVRSGALVPITVYWVEAPEPTCGLDAYSKYQTRDGKIRNGWLASGDSCRMIADVLNCIPDELQTLCMLQFIEQMGRIHALCTKSAFVHAETRDAFLKAYPTLRAIKPKERKEIYDAFRKREINSIISTHCWKQGVDFPELSVVVNAGGGGSDIVAKQVPGRASRASEGKDHAYIVDFVHSWDRVDPVGRTGRPGPLLSNDFARRKAYKDLGFEQCKVQSIAQLPFLDQALVQATPTMERFRRGARIL